MSNQPSPTTATLGRRPFVQLRLPDGTVTQAGPGDLIGRQWNCAVCLPDQRVSEAHAMISLRGGDLRLLCLRGGLAINGERASDPILEVGQRIGLAPDLELEVLEVRLPAELLAIEGPDLTRHTLTGVVSLYTSPVPRISGGHRHDAAAWLFSDGMEWFVRRRGGQVEGPLTEGSSLHIDGWTSQVVRRQASAVGAPTLREKPYEPLRIESFYDTVRIFRDGELICQLHGLGARVMSELMELGQPVDWESVARQLWTDDAGRWTLRRRWDAMLCRLRGALAEANIRADLLCSDGTGCVALVPYPGDELIGDDA